MSAQAIIDAIAASRIGGHCPIEIPGADRRSLAEAFAALGFKSGAEVGVEAGKFSEVLLQSVPGLSLACVDPWLVYGSYRRRLSQEQMDEIRARCMARLSPWAKSVTYMEEHSSTAAAAVADASLDFVYIDANHALEHVVADIAAWSPKVRLGGIVSGHDWIRMRHCVEEPIHVQAAVEAWTRAYEIDPWFVLGLKGEKREERARSWFWVRR